MGSGEQIYFYRNLFGDSLFLFKWLDIGVAAENGFMQGGVLFIVCFIYPFLKVVREKKMNKLIAYAFALVAIFLTMMYVSSKTIDFLERRSEERPLGRICFWRHAGC